MFDHDRMKRSKRRVRVLVERGAKGAMEASLFLAHDERLIDALNDDRKFLPLETVLGKLLLLPKSEITEITPVDRAGKPVGLNADPCKILGVTPDATAEDLRTAYLTLVKALHPDRVRAAGLAEEFIQYATERTQLVTAAYHEITAERERRAKAEAPPA
ncbi:J domain-containing protein [Futiania mangrovi]|uniref:DnaJ domain-containing protein n=1 Tax=Futiania mangrovi TaxID=2959716 RepID=A0A9J6PHM8_9PROT|nr:DnaJ domain-containing protein [Futiania mangrovii]MCP1337320.1 DnaJ domain-containing protein [Futiania mangrovii]